MPAAAGTGYSYFNFNFRSTSGNFRPPPGSRYIYFNTSAIKQLLFLIGHHSTNSCNYYLTAAFIWPPLYKQFSQHIARFARSKENILYFHYFNNCNSSSDFFSYTLDSSQYCFQLVIFYLSLQQYTTATFTSPLSLFPPVHHHDHPLFPVVPIWQSTS